MAKPSSRGAGAAENSDGARRILQAAESLFAEQGFSAVSMSAIAATAGVSKANIYHHFATKQELYMAVLREACSVTGGLLNDMEAQGVPLRESLPRFAHAHLSSLLERAEFARLVLRELLEEGPKRGKELAEQGFAPSFARLVGIIRGGQASGELRADLDPAMVATLLIGADVFFFEAQNVLRHYPEVDFAENPPRYTDMLIDILLHGILPPAAR